MLDKNKLIKSITFIDKPILEFVSTFLVYMNIEENLKLISEYGVEIDEYAYEVIKSIDEKLSSFVKGEIEFYRPLDSIAVSVLGFAHDLETITNIGEYFNNFDVYTDEELFDYLGGAFLTRYYKADNEQWGMVNHDLNLMREYISSIDDIDYEMKDRILSLYQSPVETKMRLRHIVSSFYNVYKEFEDELVKKAREEKNRYLELVKNDPYKFIDINYLNTVIDTNEDKCKYEIDIYVSYMSHFGVNFNSRENKLSAVIGCKNIELYNSRTISTNLEKFLKLISDNTRQKILFHLAERPWYTQELSRELGITPATVNYHLQNFLLIDLITLKEEKNKVYYFLNKKVANRYLDYLKNKLKLNIL